MKSGKTYLRIKRYAPLYLMMAPAIIYLIINNYLPMTGIVLAFKKYNALKGIWLSDWVGLDNFKFLFKSQDFWIMIRNTLGYNLVFILVNLVVGVLLAILLCEVRNTALRKFFQSSILLPFAISIIIVSYMVRAFLDPETGLLNAILVERGLESVAWYSDPKYWPVILVFVNVWKGVGYSCILYVSSIMSIDQSLYEAAAIDGASKLQQIWHITLPFLKPTMITLVLLSLGRICTSDFGLFYQVPQQSGLLMDVTQTFDTYVYRAISSSGSFGMSSAVSFFQSLVGFALILIANGIARKVSKENAIF